MLRTFFSDRLDNRMLGALMRMDDAVINRRPQCMLYGLGSSDLNTLQVAYISEHPESYYCFLQALTGAATADGLLLNLFYNDSCDEAQFERCLQEIYDELDRYIDSYTSEYGVAKLVYDYFASHVKADYAAQNVFFEVQNRVNGMREERRSQEEIAAVWDEFIREHGNTFTAYGAIVEKKAVCMGFSLAYRLVLTHYGLDVACVSGMYGNGPHMLNAVAIGDRRAFVDITRGLVCEALPFVQYDMFLMPASRATYFTPDDDLECDATDLHFFAREKLQFRDLFALRRYLSSYIYAATDGAIRFYYSGRGMTDDKVRKIAEEMLAERCGNEYQIAGRTVAQGIGNFHMLKK